MQETVQNLIEEAENLTITIGEKRKGNQEVIEGVVLHHIQGVARLLEVVLGAAEVVQEVEDAENPVAAEKKEVEVTTGKEASGIVDVQIADAQTAEIEGDQGLETGTAADLLEAESGGEIDQLVNGGVDLEVQCSEEIIEVEILEIPEMVKMCAIIVKNLDTLQENVKKLKKSQYAIIVNKLDTWLIIVLNQENKGHSIAIIVTKKAIWLEIVLKREG